MTWKVEIVESTNIIAGVAIDIGPVLDRLSADGWTIHTITINGPFRWAIFCYKV